MSNYLDGILSGQSGYSKTTAAFMQPEVGSNVTVFVGNAGWAIAGVAVNIATGGAYQVVAVPSVTQLTLQNLGGANNAAPAATVPTDQVIAPGGTPGQQGAPGTPVLIATVITQNIANLAAGPLINDGYTIVSNDQVPLSGQTDVTLNGVYTANGAGAFTRNTVQPAEGQILASTKGNVYANMFYVYYAAGAIPQQSTSGIFKGVYTATDCAPDALGLPLVTNPGIPRQALTNDGNYHTVWAFDFVARGYISGRLMAQAVIFSTDSTHDALATMRLAIKCTATPTAGAPAVSYALDMLDDGAGPYFDVRWFIVGTALCLQVKSLETGTFNYVGIVGAAVGI